MKYTPSLALTHHMAQGALLLALEHVAQLRADAIRRGSKLDTDYLLSELLSLGKTLKRLDAYERRHDQEPRSAAG